MLFSRDRGQLLLYWPVTSVTANANTDPERLLLAWNSDRILLEAGITVPVFQSLTFLLLTLTLCVVKIIVTHLNCWLQIMNRIK